jgi:DNA-binding transcriptional ArsR family regulator
MQRTSELPNIARIGALIGNPVRARFIGTLMDGSERSATDLATLVSATPQSASAHLASLVAGGLLAVRPRGRHRLYRLRSEQVAAAIEVLSLTATETVQRPAFALEVRAARRCYDHVAGRLGVRICDIAVARSRSVSPCKGPPTGGAPHSGLSETGWRRDSWAREWKSRAIHPINQFTHIAAI